MNHQLPRLLCSTGVFSRHPDATDDERLDRYGPALHADGFEVMLYEGWYGRLDKIAARIRGLDLPIAATHADKDLGPDLVSTDRAVRDRVLPRFEANCAFTRALGTDRIVLHLWGLPEGDSLLERQLAVLPRLLDRAVAHGVQLAIETIPCTTATPLATIRRVLETDDRARVALDTEFLAIHGQLDDALDAEWLWDGPWVIHLHVKDFDGKPHHDDGRRRYLHPGEGAIPFPAWLSRLAERGYTAGISLESPVVAADGTVDIDRANRSLAGLSELIATAWSGG